MRGRFSRTRPMQLNAPARALGIDFGTSNSTVGWLRPEQDKIGRAHV